LGPRTTALGSGGGVVPPASAASAVVVVGAGAEVVPGVEVLERVERLCPCPGVLDPQRREARADRGDRRGVEPLRTGGVIMCE